MTAGDTPALAVRDLTWRVGGATILSQVGLSARPGEFLAVIGPNGAGKTSLMQVVTGLIRPTSGRVELAGADITRLPPHRRTRRGLGRTFQTSSLFTEMTVADNVRLAADAASGRSRRFWRGSRAGGAPDAILDAVRLGPRAADAAGALSHGDKRKLELALVLAQDPQVILLDEPMAGVNAGEVAELTEVIAAVHRDHKRTVVMVEHHMDVLLSMAERVAVLHHGQLIAHDRPEAVMALDEVQAAYLGAAR